MSPDSNIVIPIEIVNGRSPGMVLCITAAIHGNELNGIEVIRRLLHAIDPKKLTGTIVAIPIVNQEGFQNGTRCLADHADLNRNFPGSRDGSYSQRVAHTLFSKIICKCDALVDIHTGTEGRDNLPQIRVDLSMVGNRALADGARPIAIMQKTAPAGSLRAAASDLGIPAIVMEIGSSNAIAPKRVKTGVQCLRTLLNFLKMIQGSCPNDDPQPYFYGGGWVRAEAAGTFISSAKLGKEVRAGEVLGKIHDHQTHKTYVVTAPARSIILTRLQNVHVHSGMKLFRLGIKE